MTPDPQNQPDLKLVQQANLIVVLIVALALEVIVGLALFATSHSIPSNTGVLPWAIFVLPLISVGATIFGASVAYRGFRRLNATARREVVTGLFAQNAHARSLIIEHPHLRPYFFDKAVIETNHPEYNRVCTIAEIYLNYLEHLMVEEEALKAGIQKDALYKVWFRILKGEEKKDETHVWTATVETTLQLSPIMRKILDDPKSESWYAPQLHAIHTNIKEEEKRKNAALEPKTQASQGHPGPQ